MVERETKTVQGILIEHTEGGRFTSGAAEETKMSKVKRPVQDHTCSQRQSSEGLVDV